MVQTRCSLFEVQTHVPCDPPVFLRQLVVQDYLGCDYLNAWSLK